jgi:alpha-D-xyloside xylohydrolase
MLGDSLLVAPVFSSDGIVDFYLPQGEWTHLLTGEVRQGGRWHRGTYGFLEMPLFARSGRIIALGSVDDRPDYPYAEAVTFRVYGLAEGQTLSAAVPDLKGKTAATLTVSRKGRSVEASLEGTAKGWSLQLSGVKAVESAEGATAEADPLGVILTSNAGARSVRVRLPAA